MIRMRAALFVLLFVGVTTQLFALSAHAAISQYINYQGKLADDTGTPVADGLYNMEFKLHNDPNAGSTVWTETRTGANKVQVTNGLFSVLLGDVTTISDVNFNQPLYLSINIGGTSTISWDGEMTPRRALSSVPSAFVADTALSLDATYATSSTIYVSTQVGVGTSSPTATLSLQTPGVGNAGLHFSTDIYGASITTSSGSNSGLLYIRPSGGGMRMYDNATAYSFDIWNAGTQAINLNSNGNSWFAGGNLGVGTTTPYQELSIGGDLALTGRIYDSAASAGSNGMVLLSTGSATTWVATSTLGLGGGTASPDSLQTAYETGATIETSGATSSVVITETTAANNTHDLLQLTANPATGGSFRGDALQITMDAADSEGNIGNGLHVLVDQSQTTGYPILVEDDAGVDLFAVAESGGLTVGSATARSGVEIFGDLTNKGYKKSLGISGIIDVFIYDTTKDSDAGRWRLPSNTEFKSWYTEAKNDGIGDVCVPASDTRCGASEFPAKAIIVSTADSVYIFDANTNTMWMKFSQNASGYALGVDTNNNPSGIGALNGTIYVGTNGSAGTGVYAFDFISDRLYNYDSTDRSQGDKNIANRNTAVAYATDNQTSYAIANNVVNDVHAAVLSQSGSAVINTGTATGKRFLAVATDASASVISLDGARTIDYADGATTDDVNQVWLTSRGRLYFTNETLAQVELYTAVDADTVDQNAPDDVYDEQTGNQPNTSKTAPTFATTPDALQVLERESFADAQNQLALAVVNSLPGGDVIYVGHSAGLSELHTVGIPSTAVLGWSKFYSTSGVTALMNGTPRAMFTMNDASGDITDATIRNNVLDAKGTPTYRVNGVHDFGMSFNGTSQYACSDANNDATCDQDTDFDAGLLGFTIELWFKHSTSISGTDTLVDHSFTTGPAAAVGGYRVWMDSSGLIRARIDDDATFGDEDPLASPAGKSYADGQWHHLVFERVSTAFASPNAPMAAGIYLFIDGVMVSSDTTIAASGTLTAANVPLAIGADCSVGANCSTGANFWDGSIDDVYISMGGATTSDSPNAAAGAIARKYAEGKAAMLRPSTQVSDATTFTSTTIGKTGVSYVPNEFVGEILEITGGVGAGQTRRIVSNDATTFTVSPAFSVTPDATSDYEVVAEQLYGASNSVTSIGVTDTDPLNTSRTLYVGTSDGSDGGGITVLSGFNTPSVSDVYHSNAGITDDGGTAWSGTDYDDMTSIDIRSGISVFGSIGNLWMKKDDRALEQSMDLLLNSLATVRQELLADGLQAGALTAGGADLAELYGSTDDLQAGEIVALDPAILENVVRSTSAYQRDVIGIVATRPGLVLGPTTASTTYPIALVGRVPVKVTTENGVIRAGDRVTTSSTLGHGMRATQAGRVLGTALEDLDSETLTFCSDDSEGETTKRCGQVMVFVNLVDYSGMSVSLLAREQTIVPSVCGVEGETSTSTEPGVCEGVTTEGLLDGLDTDNREADPREILSFLTSQEDTGLVSEIFTGRLSAAFEVIAPKVYTDTLSVGSIESSSEDGGVSVVLGEGGRFEVRRETDPNDPFATTSPLITFDAEGNALFSGTISAQSFTVVDTTGTSTGTSTPDMLSVTDRLERIEGLLAVSESTSTEATSSEMIDADMSSFVTNIEEQISIAVDMFRTAISQSFAVVALYAKNMFAATITIVPEGRVIVPSGENQISGMGRIPLGETSVVIENSATLSTSKIFITPLSLIDHPLIVTLKQPGVGFTVSMVAPATFDVFFDWLIVDSYPTDETTTSIPGETVVEDEPAEVFSEVSSEEIITDESQMITEEGAVLSPSEEVDDETVTDSITPVGADTSSTPSESSTEESPTVASDAPKTDDSASSDAEESAPGFDESNI